MIDFKAKSNRKLPGTISWTAHWVLIAAASNIAGWLLSLFGGLTPLGLAAGIFLAWIMLLAICQPGAPDLPDRRTLSRFINPKRHPLRCAFLAVTLLSLAGGLLHAPNNFDAMNFRLPKVLGWLMEGGWQWFPANNNSLNTRASGMEWVMAPLLAWTGSDRLLFLTNQLPFLLLPGLVFGVFHNLGVPGRVSRFWMWIVPTGYGFALQAGGIGNDLPAAVFALAAFDLALRWRKSGQAGHALLALLAAGMMTAVKPTTLPLMLPFAVLFIRMFGLLRTNPVRVALAITPLALASFLPTAVLNHRHCGDWTGAAAENAALGKVEPWMGIAGNLINAPLQNLVPPIFPIANLWNENVIHWFPKPFLDRMARNFEARGARFGVTDIQGEESAGLGLGVVGLLFAGAIFGRRPSRTPQNWKAKAGWIGLWFGLALLAYFGKAGMTTVARHILPYYPFLMVPFLMIPRFQGAVRRKWFWGLSGLAMVSTMLMLFITPSRPVLPMAMISRALADRNPSPALQRLALGYEVYGDRADVLGSLRDALPDDAREIGLINHAAGTESPLWKPYGQRMVRHLTPEVDPAEAVEGGMRFIVVNTRQFSEFRGESPEDWIARLNGEIMLRQEIRSLVKEPPSEWWVVQLPVSESR